MTFRALLILVGALSLAGCGYRQGGSGGAVPAGYQWLSLYPSDVRTVAVPVFTNRSLRRGVEFALTRAVVNQLEATTPYKVVDR